MDLKGSKTEKNLMTAFAGESQARNKYNFYAKIAKEEGIAEDGYRLIVNCNKHGGQEVFHIHMHLVGGEPLGRMLAK